MTGGPTMAKHSGRAWRAVGWRTVCRVPAPAHHLSPGGSPQACELGVRGTGPPQQRGHLHAAGRPAVRVPVLDMVPPGIGGRLHMRYLHLPPPLGLVENFCLRPQNP